jgi:hypothetical protein
MHQLIIVCQTETEYRQFELIRAIRFKLLSI